MEESYLFIVQRWWLINRICWFVYAFMNFAGFDIKQSQRSEKNAKENSHWPFNECHVWWAPNVRTDLTKGLQWTSLLDHKQCPARNSCDRSDVVSFFRSSHPTRSPYNQLRLKPNWLSPMTMTCRECHLNVHAVSWTHSMFLYFARCYHLCGQQSARLHRDVWSKSWFVRRKLTEKIGLIFTFQFPNENGRLIIARCQILARRWPTHNTHGL